MTEEEILQMLENRDYKNLKAEFENWHPVDIANLLEEFNERQRILVFRLLAKEEAAETFTYMSSEMQEDLVSQLTDAEIEEVMEEMYLDDIADVLEEMPANLVDKLLQSTDEETRLQINTLLQYPEDSAGSIMNVEYIALRKEMTVADAILKIRQVGINRETIYTCYVTEKRKLVGVVDVKDLLTTGENRLIEEIMETNMVYVHTHDDQEDVVSTINKYNLIAIPVVDYEMCMVGVVTVDDAKSRFPWLLFLMLSATITGLLLGHYEDALAVMPLLNTFVPMLTGTGGNCGSQSSTLVIRGLAVDEIEFGDIFKVVFKEIRVALLVGFMLAVVNGIRVIIMYHDPLLAFALGITLICTVMLAKTIGCMLPLVAKKLGLDPAIMAAPLITTLVDTGTIFVYFTIVTRIFNL